MANLRPFHEFLLKEDGDRLLAEDSGLLALEFGHASAFRQEGEPYQFIILETEGETSILLLEEQPHTEQSIEVS